MTHRPGPRKLSGGWLVLSLLALLGLAAALAGGVVAWQRLHAPTFHHTPNAINTGKSILYFSKPGFNTDPTQLTMVRASDGTILWQYVMNGVLSIGEAPTMQVALAAGQVVEVANGVIYFVVEKPAENSSSHEQDLMALRADTGAVLWRRSMPGFSVELFGVSDGVVCIRVTEAQGSQLTSSALFGYDARTGAVVWQRQDVDASGTKSTQYNVALYDGILYVSGELVSPLPTPMTIHALLASTGQTLWQYSQPSTPGSQSGHYFFYPVATDQGVVVMYSWGGDLLGMREKDGAVLWRYQATNILFNVPHGEFNGPGILERGGALYFGTSAADGSLQLNSLQMTTGRLLWRQPISAAKSALWDLAVGDDGVYAMILPQWLGMHPVFDGLQISSRDTRSGDLHWQTPPATAPNPYFASAGAVLVIESGSTLLALSADSGATLWRHPNAEAAGIAVVNGAVIYSSIGYTGSDTWTSSLCSLQETIGATRWCDQIAMGSGLFVVGP